MNDIGDGADGSPQFVVSTHDPDVEVPAQIRRELRRILTDWQIDGDVTDDALLVVEELVTNVVDHARTPFRLLVRHDGNLLHLSVHDGVPARPHVLSTDADRVRGQGLRIVEGVSRRWGCETDDTGKNIWAEFDT